MRIRYRTLALLLGFLLLETAVFQDQVQAQSGSRAGIVVRFDDERTESRCVSFAEDEINGYTLLQRSGLALDVKSGGQGGLVCAIEGTGCGIDNCLCQCQGEPCVYWSYWRLADEGWAYSVVGSTVRKLSDGDVDGWSWGPGSITSAIEPPDLTFDEICGDGQTIYDGSAAVSPGQPVNWLPYALFAAVVAAIGLGALFVRRKGDES